MPMVGTEKFAYTPAGKAKAEKAAAKMGKKMVKKTKKKMVMKKAKKK
jgi:hypothetical protein